VTSRDTRRDALLLAGLVAVAVVLRAVAAGQALYGDELFTYDDVVRRSFGSMLDRVRQVEDTPPLFFVVAWASAKLGGAEGLGLRLPSLLAAGATVPLLHGVGRRALGREAALLGAALFAVSPFAVFYGSEARAYSLMAFLVVLATCCLLRATDGGGGGWWVGFAAAAAASVYTHYTAAAVVAAVVGWALVFRPPARRAAALATAGAALAVAPWLALGPKASGPGLSTLFPFTAKDMAKTISKVAAGHPFAPLHELPGTAGVVLLAVAALAVAAGGLLERRARPLSSGAWLVLAATLATPLAVAAYSAVRSSIFAPRNLYASLPFGCLVAAGLVAAAGRLRAIAAAAMVAALLVTTVRSEQADHQRPPFDDVAARLNHRPGRVIVLDLFAVGRAFGRQPLLDSLAIHLTDRSRAVEVVLGDDRAYRAAAVGPLVSVVVTQTTGLEGDPPQPPAPSGYVLVRRERFPGFSRIGLFTFGRSPRRGPA
jgi:hypothetical protein